MNERRKYLLQKVKDKTITDKEIEELRKILENNKNLDELIKLLAVLGIGTLSGYLIAKELKKKENTDIEWEE